LRKEVKGKTPEEIGEKAGKIILEKMIKPSVKKMGIKFDKWFSEKTLYKNKEVDEVIDEVKEKGFTYESEGALWFKSTDLGDDKDRVLIRADGIKTYFASDIAYLRNKFDRGFEKLIIFLGADHYGYVARLKAGCHALGYKKEDIDAIVLQLVRLFENGKEVRMSKRTGIYVTIDELIDEVGLDVARFFFLQRSLNTHFNFDMDLAKEKSDKNPVFKVQYAYARINSIFTKSKIKNIKAGNLELLKEPEELDLIKQLIRLPEIIKDIADDYQLQRLPTYALEISDAFHRFYEKCKVITEDKKLTNARLSLILAVKIVLENVLELMGVSAPEKMMRNEIK
jgi:arginyl-tRNA synthetase